MQGKVFHFHPAGLDGQLAKLGSPIDVDELLMQYEKTHTHFSPAILKQTSKFSMEF